MILLTGAFGFIGMHAARAFLDAGQDLILTRNRTYREPEFLKDDIGRRAVVEQVDVTNPDQLITLGKRYEIDGICHLAGPGYSAPDAAADYRINVFGLLNLLEAARQWEVKRLTLASSIATYYYGGAPRGPFAETMPLRMTAANPIETYKKVELYAPPLVRAVALDRSLLGQRTRRSMSRESSLHRLLAATRSKAAPLLTRPVNNA